MPKAAVFDLQKLFWLNGQHIGKTDAAALVEKCGGISAFMTENPNDENTLIIPSLAGGLRGCLC